MRRGRRERETEDEAEREVRKSGGERMGEKGEEEKVMLTRLIN